MLENLHQTSILLFFVSLVIISAFKEEFMPFWLKCPIICVFIASMFSALTMSFIIIWR